MALAKEEEEDSSKEDSLLGGPSLQNNGVSTDEEGDSGKPSEEVRKLVESRLAEEGQRQD